MSLARANAKEQGKGGHLSSDVPVGNVIASLPIVGLSRPRTGIAGQSAGCNVERYAEKPSSPRPTQNSRRMENGLSKV